VNLKLSNSLPILPGTVIHPKMDCGVEIYFHATFVSYNETIISF
jgi:hypothetical protein